MRELAAIIRRFPSHELIIRRLYAQKPEFRTLCEDYATAQSALERWGEDEGKADEFRRLSAEIAEEIHEQVQSSLGWSRH